MNIVSTRTDIVDTAVGPLVITDSDVTNYDVDDYAHTAIRAQALKIQLMNSASLADPRYANYRMPISIGGVNLGGF